MDNFLLWIEVNQIYIILAIAIFSMVLLLIILIQAVVQKKLKQKMKAYETGSLNKTLEQAINDLQKEVDTLRNELIQEKKKINRINRREKKAIKKVKLIKYNAFETQGGNISYAMALLNEEDSGVLINSIHSTDFSFSYAKEVLHGQVNQVMSKEEEDVLKQAIHGNTK